MKSNKIHGNTGKLKNNLSGRRFGKLTVIERLANTKDGRVRYKCLCDCGNETIGRSESLQKGKKKSCGCLHRKSHGDADHRKKKQSVEYSAWAAMISRCRNPKNNSYHNYGGRGISVSTDWINNYPAFLNYVGRRPSPRHSLDRIDVNGNYEPGNVRWATASEQVRNRRPFQHKGWRQAAKHAWGIVRDFEHVVASYTGAPYAVAVDSCTNALLLACAYFKVEEVEIPRFTYIGVGMSILNAKGKIKFRSENWSGMYQLKPYPIYDSARLFTSGMYIPGTMMALSCHWTKHLAIGHGGLLLTDSKEAVKWLKKARFDGRTEGVAPKRDVFDMIGWHVPMSPTNAAQGLLMMAGIKEHNDPLPWGPGTASDYPDLSNLEIFK